MKLSKPLKKQSIDGSKITDWITFVTDERGKLVIPVGARFQVEVPPWTPPVSTSFGNPKWLGTKIWPAKGKSTTSTNRNMVGIGKGRKENCDCAFPGSIECVRKHVSKKRFQLQIDIGPVFWTWKFDEMGEDVSKSWSLKEERKFEYIVKMNTNSKGKNLLKTAIESLPGKSRGSIVSYYLNVYVPRRFRTSCINIDTDGEDDDDDDADNMLSLKGARKRLQADCVKSRGCKYAKSTYLKGRH